MPSRHVKRSEQELGRVLGEALTETRERGVQARIEQRTRHCGKVDLCRSNGSTPILAWPLSRPQSTADLSVFLSASRRLENWEFRPPTMMAARLLSEHMAGVTCWLMITGRNALEDPRLRSTRAHAGRGPASLRRVPRSTRWNVLPNDIRESGRPSRKTPWRRRLCRLGRRM